ncbi:MULTISPECIES: HAD family hydrolase [Halomicrobium]|uniref:Haloacid dehalogenase domain protein hydrolase n=2 Tax=Halomicrobium mukohataei TaxID=57705 RepID=C7NWE2_HALMD|nr:MULTISPECIES: HAD family hydrolase [Halomicrobium]ACV46283.1 Haloacid dehalogenase domain protein hydrolase [Halomicrobium mukohataei DSM 12286]QCD64843.1 HAD family hydrolase [Halomicrobium mukohataei]QFR19650.1 HAD family hydrolase [Halomicrobium sp. ZPS1]
MVVSFDCFGTLVDADRPEEPWAAVADALAARDVTVPSDWEAAYRSSHREYERGAEAPLDEHVRLALASRGVDIEGEAAHDATLAAFDSPVTVRDGARIALASAREYGPVAVCSNCSVPGLVERTLDRADLAVDSVVTSVGCGWRKPHPTIFERTAAALAVPLDELVHVGDDARTDGGADRVGATALVLDDVALSAVPEWLAAAVADAASGEEPP